MGVCYRGSAYATGSAADAAILQKTTLQKIACREARASQIRSKTGSPIWRSSKTNAKSDCPVEGNGRCSTHRFHNCCGPLTPRGLSRRAWIAARNSPASTERWMGTSYKNTSPFARGKRLLQAVHHPLVWTLPGYEPVHDDHRVMFYVTWIDRGRWQIDGGMVPYHSPETLFDQFLR